MNIYDELLKIFAPIGFVAFAVIVILFIAIIKEVISDFIRDKKWKYKYKHRFDVPPLAKCYCKDCKYYNENSGNCMSHSGWKMADNWFCWEATPRKTDPEKEK